MEKGTRTASKVQGGGILLIVLLTILTFSAILTMATLTLVTPSQPTLGRWGDDPSRGTHKEDHA